MSYKVLLPSTARAPALRSNTTKARAGPREKTPPTGPRTRATGRSSSLRWTYSSLKDVPYADQAHSSRTTHEPGRGPREYRLHRWASRRHSGAVSGGANQAGAGENRPPAERSGNRPLATAERQHLAGGHQPLRRDEPGMGRMGHARQSPGARDRPVGARAADQSGR